MPIPDALRTGPRRRDDRRGDGARLSAKVWRDRLHRTMLDVAMPSSLFVHDHEGWLVEANARACQSLGYTREELLAMNVIDVEQDFDLPAAQAAWRCVEEGAQNILYGRHMRKDGSVFPVEVHIGLMQVGGVRFYVGLVSDIASQGAAVETLPMKAAMQAAAGGHPEAAFEGRLDWRVEADSILRGLVAQVGPVPRNSKAELEWVLAGVSRLSVVAGAHYGARFLDIAESLQAGFEAWLGPHERAYPVAVIQAARSELTANIRQLTVLLLGPARDS